MSYYLCHKIKKATKSVTFIFIYISKESDTKKKAGDKTTEITLNSQLSPFKFHS